MKNRDKILPVIVLLLTASGFLLPDLTARLVDIRMEEETEKIRDTQKEIPLAHAESYLEILEGAGTMKQAAELRTGEYMNMETAEKKAEDLRNMLVKYGLVHYQGENRWLISPVLVSDAEDQETARVLWDCVWYSGIELSAPSKIEICIDDETGYLISFTAYPGTDGSVEDPLKTAESMKAFLNDYYPLSGRTEFSYTEKQKGNEFVFTVADEKKRAYELRFLIMENGQVVFNM